MSVNAKIHDWGDYFFRDARGIAIRCGEHGGRVDFIERMFGVSPDGGDGSLEWMYWLSVAVAITLTVYGWYRRRQGRGDTQ
jgi:hypothetical protein